MVQVNFQKMMNVKIKKLAASEKTTKAVLSELSRDALTYIALNHSTDIATVNRLLDALTPMNLKVAALFFNNFLPFKLNTETDRFDHMVKGDKLLAKYQGRVEDFMANKDNDIWSWAERNVEIDMKPKDYAGKVTALVGRALHDENESITASALLSAVMAGGISLNDLWGTYDTIQKLMKSDVDKSGLGGGKGSVFIAGGNKGDSETHVDVLNGEGTHDVDVGESVIHLPVTPVNSQPSA